MQNLTVQDVERLIGTQACVPGSTGATCRLIPAVRQLALQFNRNMGGGHCEGFAVLSGRFFFGQQDPMDLGAASASAFPFDMTTGLPDARLQREIAFYMAQQWLRVVQSATILETPNDVVRRLRESFASPTAEKYDIYIFRNVNGRLTSGHAVLPYGVRQVDADTVDILVYDNNFPREPKAIRVNTAMNTWRYETSSNPTNPADVYEGAATPSTLQLSPLSTRIMSAQNCMSCGDYTRGMAAMRRVSSTGSANVLLRDSMNRRVGTMGGETFDEIPGARTDYSVSTLWRDEGAPRFEVPGGTPLTAVLQGDLLDEQEEQSLFLEGPGYYLGVEEILLDPMQVDTITLGPDEARISYETTASETATVAIALQTEGADWIFAIRSRGDAQGQTIEAFADIDGGVFEFDFVGNDEFSEFDMLIVRVGDTEDLVFVDEMVQVTNGSELSLRYGDFDVNGESLALTVDPGGGQPRSTIDLLDEGDGMSDL